MSTLISQCWVWEIALTWRQNQGLLLQDPTESELEDATERIQGALKGHKFRRDQLSRRYDAFSIVLLDSVFSFANAYIFLQAVDTIIIASDTAATENKR